MHTIKISREQRTSSQKSIHADIKKRVLSRAPAAAAGVGEICEPLISLQLTLFSSKVITTGYHTNPGNGACASAILFQLHHRCLAVG